MPEPLPPDRAADAVTSDRDKTVFAAVPAFGPPAAAGEIGVLGPYRVVEQLGNGGMGCVYLAVDTRLDRKLALKVMLPAFAADRDAKERFLREAKAAAKVSHDNVVTVFEADERDGVPYIAMQFLQGTPLDAYLKQKGVPALPHVIRIGRETALGLAAAHALGLVHRDIKPANLWLESPNGRVKVLDFGLAKPVGGDTELTKSGAVMGTPAYMSPEQARGLKVDHRTDLYSLGAVLYRLCTGKTPFAGEHVMAVLAAVLTDEPTPVRELNPNVPESLARLIHELLAKKPDARPQTANDVARHLRGILDQLLTPNAPAVAATPSGGASNSLPVVVHALPHQPPVVVPMQITARPEDVFANLDGDDDEGAEETEAEAAPAAPRSERKTGGKGVLIATGVAVLLAVGAGAVVVSQMGKKKGPEANGPDTGGEKGKADPKEPIAPAGSLPATYKNGIGMEFVKVSKGTGWLGGGVGKPGNTKLVIEQDFYLGKYEVTQEEWEKVTGLTPSYFSRNGPGAGAVKDISDADLKRFPVEQVSWDDCQLFIERLNTREKDTGWVYRLPKESEWEYACRGGSVDRLDSAFDFYFAKPTNTLLPEKANFNNVYGRTCKVGSYESNLIGLYDMHGNINEWCDDAVTSADGASHRVCRGGVWLHAPGYCRAAARYTHAPSDRGNAFGLRLARVPVAPVGKAAAADPDRKAAEWVLSIGGNVRVRTPDGAERDVGAAADLPAGPIAVVTTNLVYAGDKVTDDGLAHLVGLSSLVYVHIASPRLTDDGLRHLADLTKLRQLFLLKAAITDAGLARLDRLGSLEDLRLADTPVTDAGLEHVAKLKSLKFLSATGSKVTLDGLRKLRAALPGCRFDTSYEVELVAIDPAWPPDRKAATWVLAAGGGVTVRVGKDERGIGSANDLPKEPFQVTDINLDGKAVTEAGMANLKGCTGLRVVILHSSGVTDKGLLNLADSKGLRALYLNRTPVTDAGLVFLKECKEFATLFADGTGIGEKTFDYLKESERLTEVVVAAGGVTDAGLLKLKNCTTITFFGINGTGVIGSCFAEFKDLSKLEGIRCEGSGLTDAGLMNLARAKNLKNINPAGTGVTMKGAEAFHAALPTCRVEINGRVFEAKK